jgi:hypothetical protein
MIEQLKKILLLSFYKGLNRKQKAVLLYFGTSFSIFIVTVCSNMVIPIIIATVNLSVAAWMIDVIDVDE